MRICVKDAIRILVTCASPFGLLFLLQRILYVLVYQMQLVLEHNICIYLLMTFKTCKIGFVIMLPTFE